MKHAPRSKSRHVYLARPMRVLAMVVCHPYLTCDQACRRDLVGLEPLQMPAAPRTGGKGKSR